MPEKKEPTRRQLDQQGPHYHVRLGGHRFYVVRHAHVWHPPTDVMEDDDGVCVLVEIAGMQDGEFHVALDDKRLVIGGVRPAPKQAHSYHQLEVHYGEFRTELTLPFPIDEEQIEAHYNDGFLFVKLPRVKPRKVKVVDVDKAHELPGGDD